ncbi:MAG: hypothetical protein ACXWXL_03270 [Candidatus Binatia bacterium]
MGDGAGRYPDLDQVLKNLSYETGKKSLQFSIRALIKNGWAEKLDLERRRGQDRRVLKLTPEGFRIVKPHLRDPMPVDNCGHVL